MRPLLLLCTLLSLSACASRHVESGEASWYGKDFRGKPTASGEPFRPTRRTAAHKTLPLGTVLVVKRLDTKERVRVVVNDRGPYAHGRILDLSRRAARKLGMLDDGVSRVQIKAVGCKKARYACE